MGQRTDIAKALRDDDIQYLTALASGKPAEKHVVQIVGDYRLSYKDDVLTPFFIPVFPVLICLMLLNGEVSRSTSAILAGFVWFCYALVFLHRLLLIHDYRTAEEIYPEVNSLLGAQTEFVPSWGQFVGTIFFFIILSILFVLRLSLL